MYKLNRLGYLAHSIGAFILSSFGFVALDAQYIFTAVAMFVLAVGWQFYAMFGRLNDLNATKWLAALTFVPVVSFFLFLYLLFARGYGAKMEAYGSREVY